MKKLLKKLLNSVYKKTFGWKIFGESVSLIKFIGISFIILGIGSMINLVELTPMAILGFSTSGIFFILSDVAKHYTGKWESKKALGKSRMDRVKLYHLFNVIFLFAGIFFLICGPFLKIDMLVPYLKNLGETLALIAIGLTIFKISLENEKQNIDMMLEIADDTQKIAEYYDEKLKEK